MKGKLFKTAFLVASGVIAGVLLAPKSGKETKNSLPKLDLSPVSRNPESKDFLISI